MSSKTKVPLFPVALLAVILSACGISSQSAEISGIDPNEVATIVAATLQAELGLGDAGDTEDAAEGVNAERSLPQSLYFISSKDGKHQVWRLGADGVTLQMISLPSSDVSGYDVSPVDGSVAYVSDNRLYLVSPDGQDSLILLDASTADSSAEDYYYRELISSPRFSPDGRTLAYALNGIWLLDLPTGNNLHILENELEELESGSVVPEELYFPESWSPDGEKLLVAISYLEAGTLAILDPANGIMTPLIASGIVCCQTQWAPDNSSILVASPYIGLIEPGLWRYDVRSGAESVLIEGSEGDSVFNFVGWPLQGPVGELYYFYTSMAGFPDGDIPLLMIRSAADGNSDRVQLRSDSLVVREALWAPDGSLALIVQALQSSSGPLVLAKTDGSPLLILANDAQDLRWGP